MNPDSISNERHFNLADESLSDHESRLIVPIVAQAAIADQPSQSFSEEKGGWDDYDGYDGFDGEEGGLAKAPTLMIDEPQRQKNSQSVRVPAETIPRFYVQGIVQDRQVYVATNLLDGKSQVLFQSQMVWTIGRNRDAALPLRDRVLSRRHAVILHLPAEGFYLIDLNSMNGSYVNGAKIQQRQLLRDGDRVRLGNVEFSFFVSFTSRTIAPIHPEVLARFTNPKVVTQGFMDFSELEEPEISFNAIHAGNSK